MSGLLAKVPVNDCLVTLEFTPSFDGNKIEPRNNRQDILLYCYKYFSCMCSVVGRRLSRCVLLFFVCMRVSEYVCVLSHDRKIKSKSRTFLLNNAFIVMLKRNNTV